MASTAPQIYRFPNATMILWNSTGSSDNIALLEDGKPLAPLAGVLDEETIKSLGGSWRVRLHAASSGDLELVLSVWTREVVSYIPKDESAGIRELTEEDFEKLTPSFQRLYKKKLSEATETRTTIEHELKVVDYELSQAVLLGKEFPTELHRLTTPARERARRSSSYGYYSRNEELADLKRNLPLSLTSEEILGLINSLSSAAVPATGWAASVRTQGYGTLELEITFYAAPYGGAVRKKPALKQNGRPYADGRGSIVKELPAIVGKAVVTQGDLAEWWSAIGGNELSDSAKLEALKTLTRHLWKVSE